MSFPVGLITSSSSVSEESSELTGLMEKMPCTGLPSLYALGDFSFVILGTLTSTISAQSKCSLGTVIR